MIDGGHRGPLLLSSPQPNDHLKRIPYVVAFVASPLSMRPPIILSLYFIVGVIVCWDSKVRIGHELDSENESPSSVVDRGPNGCARMLTTMVPISMAGMVDT